MIKALSPYYYTTPWVSAGSGLTSISYTLNLYIWSGDVAAIPAVTIQLSKDNATAETVGGDDINISRIIADYIDFAPQAVTVSGSINGVNQWWVRTSVVYVTSAGTEAAQYATTTLFNRAYSYGSEGSNVTTFTNNILMSGTEFKVDRTGVFCVPVQDAATPMTASIVSYPDNEINLPAHSDAFGTLSTEQVLLITVDLTETTTDTYVEIIYNGVTITLLIEDETKYTPLNICFQNKDGQQQFITFFKEREDSINVTSSMFESDRGQPSGGYHQFVNFNVQAQEKFKIKIGWQDETMNETFKQLLLSERIWSFNGTSFTPLTIESKQLVYKTQKKQRLINYEIEFKPAYNVINNI